jgi:hypothetical protein
VVIRVQLAQRQFFGELAEPIVRIRVGVSKRNLLPLGEGRFPKRLRVATGAFCYEQRRLLPCPFRPFTMLRGGASALKKCARSQGILRTFRPGRPCFESLKTTTILRTEPSSGHATRSLLANSHRLPLSDLYAFRDVLSSALAGLLLGVWSRMRPCRFPRCSGLGSDFHGGEFALLSRSLVGLCHASNAIFEPAIPLGKFCCHHIRTRWCMNSTRGTIRHCLSEVEFVAHWTISAAISAS